MRRSLLMLALGVLAACSREAPAPPAAGSPTPMAVAEAVFQAGETTVNLPRAIGPWTRPDAPKVVTAETIFDYMDGGGELYVGYRFDHLDVFEYTPADAALGTILVELYWMKHPDDAFGVLSTDWTGEVAPFDSDAGGSAATPAVPPHRALYGAGLLRMQSGRLYLRALAARETERSREAVLTIGREIGRSADPSRTPDADPPMLVTALAPETRDAGELRPDRTCFFRSHLVLNSAYYLASEDILGLGLDVEGVTTEFRPASAGARPVRLILVRYPSPARARTALTTFTQAYLPDVATKVRADANGSTRVEHGWVAWAQEGHGLALALDASSSAAATTVAASAVKALRQPGSAKR